MAMENTVVWGFCGSDGRAIVTKLRERLKISLWFSDQDSADSIRNLLDGNIPNRIKRDSNAVKFFNWFYDKYFPLYSVMINRRGLNFTDTHELTNEFALTYYYFYDLLLKQDAKLIIFANLPHEGPDFILYQLAKILNIKTLLCYQNILPNQIILTTSIEDFGRFKMIPSIFKDTEIILEAGYQQKLVNMSDVKKQQLRLHKGHCMRFVYTTGSYITKALYYAGKAISLLRQPKKINLLKISKFFLSVSLSNNFNQRIKKYLTNREVFEKLLNKSKKVVYFPLHLQPELTTSTLGGVFQDQLYAIEALSNLLDDDWVIVVKENPKQNYFQRGEKFFQRLSNIKNVFLVDGLFPSHEIIKKSIFTATIAGTAGWETIKGGGKCLIFGQAWYMNLTNCITYNSSLTSKELDEFLALKNNKSEFVESFKLLVTKFGIGVVDKDYISLLSDYSPEANAVNVVDSIMTIINHPDVIWH
jgi:hypothetical protein